MKALATVVILFINTPARLCGGAQARNGRLSSSDSRSRAEPLMLDRSRRPMEEMERPRRKMEEHYEDQHCVRHFSLNPGTIIRTENSKARGAVFLNETEESSIAQCLHACCSTSLCNVAVFDEMDAGSCYMFDCGTADDFKCQFTGNDQFVTAILDVNRHEYETSAKQRQRTHTNELERLSGRTRKNGADIVESESQLIKTTIPPAAQSETCGRWQFQCRNGDCIAIYDVCNGLPECDDGSDEDAASCPSTATAAPVTTTTQHIHVRPDMDLPSSGAFKHKNTGLQVGPNYRYPAQQWTMSDNRAMQELFPQDPRVANPMMNVPRNNFGPDFLYQNPVQNQYNPYQQIPPGQMQPQYPPPQQLAPTQLQQRPPKQPTKKPAPRLTRKTTVKTVTTRTTAVTSPPVTEKVKTYEEQLIEDLADELTPMETPGAAIFTLVVGIIITALLVIIVACRVKKSRFRRKSLAHEAEGDYLVNGMYL